MNHSGFSQVSIRMAHGFLGNQASFMLDVIVCALILIVPTIGISLYQVKVRRNFALHRRLQIALGLGRCMGDPPSPLEWFTF